MAKLSFNISPPAPPQPIFPAWLRVVLYVSIVGVCGALITAAITG